MKVGILTFHRPINYGAFLQSYSLSSRLNKIPEVQAEIIDYIAPKENKKIYINALIALKRRGIGGLWQELKKIRVFKQSLSELPLSERHLCTNDLTALFVEIEATYDLLVIGSDAVFNWNQNGFPTAFIPDYNWKIPVMTYAASVHGLHYFKESEDRIVACCKSFHQMGYIGTRDVCTEQFVVHCAPDIQPKHCCDPTCFINTDDIAKKADVSSIYKRYNMPQGKEFLVLMLQDDTISKAVYDRYSHRYTIVSLFKPQKYSDVFMYDLTPFEWAAVLAQAVCVVTNYFHGALLSYVQKVPAVVVDLSCYEAPYEGKLKDLLIRRLGLKELYFPKEGLFDVDQIVTLLEVTDHAIAGQFQSRIEAGMRAERDCFADFERELKAYLHIN